MAGHKNHEKTAKKLKKPNPFLTTNNFNKNMGSMVYSIGIIIFFAVVLGFAIVYNSSVISLAERKSEFALLRVVGFTQNEISSLLWKPVDPVAVVTPMT
jgi:ABC-type antimicrobial peptide transport system permease subunit